MKKNVVAAIVICLITVVLVACVLPSMTGCAAIESAMKDFESDTVGIERVVTLYDYTGNVMDTWEGNMRLETSESGEASFIIDGKRTVIEGGIVVIQEV